MKSTLCGHNALSVLIALAWLLVPGPAFSSDFTFKLDDLVGSYVTKELFWDKDNDDQSYGYNAESIQWLTFDDPIIVSGYKIEYWGKIETYPTFSNNYASGDSQKTRIYSFLGVNFNNSPPPAWAGGWQLGDWNAHSISNDTKESTITIDADGSFYFMKTSSFSSSSYWEDPQSDVGVYLDFYFDIYGTKYADTIGLITVDDAQITIMGTTSPTTPENPDSNPKDCQGYTQADLDAKYDEGFAAGLKAQNASSGPVNISTDLSFTIEDAVYNHLFGSDDIWLEFKFYDTQEGKLLWELYDFGNK